MTWAAPWNARVRIKWRARTHTKQNRPNGPREKWILWNDKFHHKQQALWWLERVTMTRTWKSQPTRDTLHCATTSNRDVEKLKVQINLKLIRMSSFSFLLPRKCCISNRAHKRARARVLAYIMVGQLWQSRFTVFTPFGFNCSFQEVPPPKKKNYTSSDSETRGGENTSSEGRTLEAFTFRTSYSWGRREVRPWWVWGGCHQGALLLPDTDFQRSRLWSGPSDSSV